MDDVYAVRPLGPWRELGAIWIFVQRDLRNQLRFRAAFLSNLAGTIPQLVVFGLIAKFGTTPPALAKLNGGYVDYVISGLVLNALLGTALSGPYRGLMESFWNDRLEVLMASPLRLPVFVVGISAGHYPQALLRIGAYLAGATLFLGFQWPQAAALAQFVLILVTALAACTGLGLLAASCVYTIDARGGQDPVRFAVETMAGLLGGIYFPVDALPIWAQVLAHAVPHTYAVDGLRRAWFGTDALPPLPIHRWLGWDPGLVDGLLLALSAAVFLPLGWKALCHGVRLARKDGRLSRWI